MVKITGFHPHLVGFDLAWLLLIESSREHESCNSWLTIPNAAYGNQQLVWVFLLGYHTHFLAFKCILEVIFRGIIHFLAISMAYYCLPLPTMAFGWLISMAYHGSLTTLPTPPHAFLGRPPAAREVLLVAVEDLLAGASTCVRSVASQAWHHGNSYIYDSMTLKHLFKDENGTLSIDV